MQKIIARFGNELRNKF